MKRLSQDEFIDRAGVVHNLFYDYSLVNYNKGADVVNIVCPLHGTFEQKASTHLRGSGCYKCFWDRLPKLRKKTRDLLEDERKNALTKNCSGCNSDYPLDQFGKVTKSIGGLDNLCKECRNKEGLKSREKHRDSINERNKKDRRENPERHKRYKKNSSPESKDKQKIKDKERKLKNKDKAKIQQKIWLEKEKSEPLFKIKRNLRSRLRHAVKGNTKSAKTLELLGCSVESLKIHLEKQFLDGMSWENYGLHGWHIDHIIPCDYFDLSEESEQRKCFHYSNLRPLWAKDNLSRPKDFSDILHLLS